MLNYGAQTPLVSLAAHIAYGTLVGGFISLASWIFSAAEGSSRFCPRASKLGGVHDDHWAVGMMSALLAHGAEQQSGKPAVPAGPDHQQIAVGGGVDKDPCGTTFHDPALDLDALGLGVQAGGLLLEQLLGRPGMSLRPPPGKLSRGPSREP